MNPTKIKNATRVLAEAQDEFEALAIRDEVVNVPGVGKCSTMVSHWRPSPSELALLTLDGVVQLRILGATHPPVILSVEDGER